MRDPASIVNRSLDALGVGIVIGAIETDGTTASEAARRVYGPTLRQLLRASTWAFARKRSTLQLLGDSTGQNPNVSNFVDPPWLYAYAWPIDCVRPRWLPWCGVNPSAIAQASAGPPFPGNIGLPGPPASTIVPNLNPGIYPLERPARFLTTASDQYPVLIGVPPDWNSYPELDGIEGVGPVNRRIILTNVPQAQLVYTYLALEIETWDELFTQALVAVLASLLAVPLIVAKDPDPKRLQLALAERNTQIAIAKTAIREARIISAQEEGYPQRTDHTPDWIKIRRSGRDAWRFWGATGDMGEGPGIFGGFGGGGWDSFGFADGSVM